MRIVHIHKGISHSGGGGGVAMDRLHHGLLRAGEDSHVLVQKPRGSTERVGQLPEIRRLGLEAKLKRATRRAGLNDIHRLGSFYLTRQELVRDADVLVFHGTHSGAFSYLALPAVSHDKPTAFVLHDMWAVTGHCGFSFDCERWRSGCGECPYLGENPPVRRDATRLEWKLKRRAFARAKITFVSKSHWMTEIIQQTSLGDHPLVEIPYGLDTEVYRPAPRAVVREALGIPHDAFVLLTVAQNLVDRRKGGDLLVEALHLLPDHIRANTHLLALGNQGESLEQATGLPVVALGYVTSDRLKAIAYSAADLMLLTSRADNSPLVMMESHACGTPVIAFRVGGIPERVHPDETGDLAEAEDSQGFAEAIVRALADTDRLSCMRQRCRDVAVREYGIQLEVERHVDLFEDLRAR